jgi:hypothetical protein
MGLIFESIISGVIAFYIGAAIFNGEPVMTSVFTLAFFLLPGLYTLDRIYRKLYEKK